VKFWYLSDVKELDQTLYRPEKPNLSNSIEFICVVCGQHDKSVWTIQARTRWKSHVSIENIYSIYLKPFNISLFTI
jgi:hypothetical protein